MAGSPILPKLLLSFPILTLFLPLIRLSFLVLLLFPSHSLILSASQSLISAVLFLPPCPVPILFHHCLLLLFPAHFPNPFRFLLSSLSQFPTPFGNLFHFLFRFLSPQTALPLTPSPSHPRLFPPFHALFHILFHVLFHVLFHILFQFLHRQKVFPPCCSLSLFLLFPPLLFLSHFPFRIQSLFFLLPRLSSHSLHRKMVPSPSAVLLPDTSPILPLFLPVSQ